MRRLLLTLACAALVGCGQTGSLYLPDKDAEVVGSPAPADAAAVESNDDADSKRDKVPAPSPPAQQ